MKINYKKLPLLVAAVFAITTAAPVQIAQATTSSPQHNTGNCKDSVKRTVVSRHSFYDNNDRKLSDAWMEVSVAGKSRYCIKAWTAGNGKKIVSVDMFNYKNGRYTSNSGVDGSFGYYESRSYTASKGKSREYIFGIRYDGKIYTAITKHLGVR